MMAIHCRDFEKMLNESIDAGSPFFRSPDVDVLKGARPIPGTGEMGVDPGRERALLDHAADCAACRRLLMEYQALGRALRAWGPAPEAPAGLVDRILASVSVQHLPHSHPSTSTTQLRRFRRISLPLAAAAAIVAVAVSAGLLVRLRIQTSQSVPAKVPSVAVLPVPSRDHEDADSRMLNVALADAADATWELARSASEPAARISGQVFDAATSQEPTSPSRSGAVKSVPSSFAVLSLDALAPDSGAAVATLQQVGDHLVSGVRPLSSTARQAFSFLLTPARPKPDVRVRPPGAKGT
jgi:hypothetical protein